MEKHRTEQVYDDEMYPLVAKLIELAKGAGIPLFVSAGMLCVVNDDYIPTTCVTLEPPETDDEPRLAGLVNRHRLCLEIVRGHSGFDTARAMTITRHYAPRDATPYEPPGEDDHDFR